MLFWPLIILKLWLRPVIFNVGEIAPGGDFMR